MQLKTDILAAAQDVGFDLAGCCVPEIDPACGTAYRDWLGAGYGGSMAYLRRNFDKRLDPRLLVPEAKTILCVGLNYFQEWSAVSASSGRVARYAWGRDYHAVVKDMLRRLAENIREIVGRDPCRRAFVDTGPVPEKALGARAGLGWVGKNGLLINDRLGSFFFLGELFLDIELPPDEPGVDRCGSCRKCLDACPTGAIVRPGIVDSRRCIAYLTIEHRGEIDETIAARMGDRLFGCDTCQEACPFNGRAVQTAVAEFRRPILGPEVDPREVLTWDESARRARTGESAGDRASLEQWHRNARIVIQNATRPLGGDFPGTSSDPPEPAGQS